MWGSQKLHACISFSASTPAQPPPPPPSNGDPVFQPKPSSHLPPILKLKNLHGKTTWVFVFLLSLLDLNVVSKVIGVVSGCHIGLIEIVIHHISLWTFPLTAERCRCCPSVNCFFFFAVNHICEVLSSPAPSHLDQFAVRDITPS